ncbi:hypothetical protein [Actinoplanes sp. NPDC026619]
MLYDPDDPQCVTAPGNRTGGGIVVGLFFVAFGLAAYFLITGSGFLDTP